MAAVDSSLFFLLLIDYIQLTLARLQSTSA
jgi:hypothetical protein